MDEKDDIVAESERYYLILKIIVFGCLLLVSPWILLTAVVISLSLKH